MTYSREFFVRHQYWRIKFSQEQNEWSATCDALPYLQMRGMYRKLVNEIPGEIERLVGEPEK